LYSIQLQEDEEKRYWPNVEKAKAWK